MFIQNPFLNCSRRYATNTAVELSFNLIMGAIPQRKKTKREER
jgi:hypothetical protein